MSAATALRDYSDVSESPGDRVTGEAIQMLYTRYAIAAGIANGKDALEVACGPGHGLGLIARKARRVVAGDYTDAFTHAVRAHYGKRIPVLRLDAHRLPFANESFDVVFLFEAIYYLANGREFVSECRRVLRPGGIIALCSANREVSGFNPSPYSTKYYSSSELAALLERTGFDAQLFGAFPDDVSDRSRRVVALVRKAAVGMRLIPRTIRGKELLKRCFYGKLSVVPMELKEGDSQLASLSPLQSNQPACRWKVLYAIGTKSESRF
jgi:SAM-dependent methyltransferase